MRLLHLQILALILCSAAMQILHLVSAKARAFLVQKDKHLPRSNDVLDLCHMFSQKPMSSESVQSTFLSDSVSEEDDQNKVFVVCVFFFKLLFVWKKKSGMS